MSGAGRGVTPGAESETGQGGNAASPGTGQDRSASADPSVDARVDPSVNNGAEAPDAGAKAADAGASGPAEDGAGPPDGAQAGGKPGQPGQPAARRGRRKRSFWR